jgi:hypothetical protein
MSTVSNNDFAIEDEVFQVNLIKWAQKKRLTFAVAVRRAGRIAAVNYAKHTQPFGLDDHARQLGEAAVARDIRRVFAPAWYVFKAIRDQDGQLADAFWYFYSIGQRRRAQQILEVSGIARGLATLPIEPLDPKRHQSLRNRRGRIPPTQGFVSIPSNPKKLATYIVKEQRMVGFCKAGYAVAARALGGTRGIPQWVTRHREAPGSVLDAAESPTDPHVIIQNRVSYASQCIREDDKVKALQDTRDNLVKFLELQLGVNDFDSRTTFNPAF